MREENTLARTATGSVISNKMDKTITVLVERRIKHPIYGKYVRRSKKFHADAPENKCKEGDLVTIVQTQPISKTKTWALKSIDREGAVI